MAAKKPHYHVQIRRNGAVCGTFGPYAKKADALADAGSLGGPGLSVAVESCSSCAAAKAPAKRRSNRTHHPRCATHIDHTLRCTCARERAYDARMKESKKAPAKRTAAKKR